MGRERYNWAPKSSRKCGGGRGGGDGAGVKGGQKDAAPPPAAAGCMTSLLHLFDFHHFQFCLHQPHAFQPTPFLPEDPTCLKGVEAPRNSLESDEMAIGTASLASITEERLEVEEDDRESFNDIGALGIQINASRRDTKLRVQTSRVTKGEHDLSSESSCSPGARTPNLVARLMGLDLLPEGCSSTSNNVTPRSSSSHPHLQQPQQNQQRRPPTANRSLPETPRVVSPSARKSHADHHSRHRLSLQIINKENRMMNEVQLELSRHSCSAISTKSRDWKLELEENKSPSHYARQLLKQVKESVLTRRFGADITNANGRRELRRDEHLLSLMDKKPQKNGARTVNESSPVKGSMQSQSPRLRALEPKGKTTVPAAPKEQHHRPPKPSLSSQSYPPLPAQKQQCLRSNKSCKNGNGDHQRFSSCVKNMPHRRFDSIRNKKDEVFVRPTTAAASRSASNSLGHKTRKMQLPRELLPASVPNFVVPFKKLEIKPTLPAIVPKTQGEASKAQAPKKVSQLSSYSSCTASTTNTTTSGWVEFQYITRILKHIGIDRDTPLSFTKWFSPSHPLNPSIFDHLERFYYSSTNTASGDPSLEHLSLKCNRKLLFELVDELLVDILSSPNHTKSKTWGWYITKNDREICGYQLVKLLCTRMSSFPRADCQVLQDTDSLLESDLPKLALESQVAIQEESEAIIIEIEHDILNSLVQDLTFSASSSNQYHVPLLFR